MYQLDYRGAIRIVCIISSKRLSKKCLHSVFEHKLIQKMHFDFKKLTKIVLFIHSFNYFIKKLRELTHQLTKITIIARILTPISEPFIDLSLLLRQISVQSL